MRYLDNKTSEEAYMYVLYIKNISNLKEGQTMAEKERKS